MTVSAATRDKLNQWLNLKSPSGSDEQSLYDLLSLIEAYHSSFSMNTQRKLDDWLGSANDNLIGGGDGIGTSDFAKLRIATGGLQYNPWSLSSIEMQAFDEWLSLATDGLDEPDLLGDFFTSLGSSVVLRYKLEETSGDFLNSGSAGSVADLALTGSAVRGVDSQTPGAGLGIEADGATTYLSAASDASFSGIEEMTILVVARPDSAGEGSLGLFVSKVNEWTLRQASVTRTVFERNMGTTNAQAISLTNSFIYGNVYAFAAKIGTDKVPHLYLNGVEMSYGTRTTGVGTWSTAANALAVASVSGTRHFDGGLFDIAVVEGELSDALILAHYEAAFLAP